MTNTNNTSQSDRIVSRRNVLRTTGLITLLSATGTNVSAETTDSNRPSTPNSDDETSQISKYHDEVLWYRTSDKDSCEEFRHVIPTVGGGVMTLGMATVDGEWSDGWQHDWTANGTKRWTVLHRQTGHDALFGGIRTATNRFALCGHSHSESEDTARAYVVETNRRGRTRWTTHFHFDQRVDDQATDIIQTADGKFVVAGSSGNRAAMATLDATGEVQWTRTYSGDKSLDAVSILEADNGFVLGGTVTKQDDTTACLLLKTNSRGREQWRRRYITGTSAHLAECISTETGYLMAGTAQQEHAFTADALVMKTTNQGDVVWKETYGDPGEHATADSVTTIGDSYVIAGSRSEDIIGEQVWLNQLNKNGDRTWSTAFGTERDETPSEVVTTDDGNLVIGGTRKLSEHDNCSEGFVAKVTLTPSY